MARLGRGSSERFLLVSNNLLIFICTSMLILILVLAPSSQRVSPSEQGSGSRHGPGGLHPFSKVSSQCYAFSHFRSCEYACTLLCCTTFFSLSISPESPRWLVHQGLFEEARITVAQTNAHGSMTDPIAVAVFKEIVDTLRWEKEQAQSMSPLEILKSPTARKRLLIGMSPGPFSCIAGNIIASYYFGSELDTAGITDTNDQLKAVSSLSRVHYIQCSY